MRPPQFFRPSPYRRAQSLIEILIAVAIGVLMIIAAVAGIVPSIKIHSNSGRTQVSAAFGRELLENVRVVAEANWATIGFLATTSANTFYLNTTSSPFLVATGTQNIAISTTTYTRYFYLNNVNRDGGGNITTGVGTVDPSTKKVTVVYGWLTGQTSSISTYITRSRTMVIKQTDWSGGPGQNGPASTTNGWFATSSGNINYTSTVGSIQLNL